MRRGRLRWTPRVLAAATIAAGVAWAITTVRGDSVWWLWWLFLALSAAALASPLWFSSRTLLGGCVSLSKPASRFIRRHGGRLFVWSEPVGDGGWIRLRASASPPPGLPMHFETRETGAVELLVEEGPELSVVGVGLSPVPRPHLVISSDAGDRASF